MKNKGITYYIYNPNSFGGCYNYAVELIKALIKIAPPNLKVELILPINSTYSFGSASKILITDKPNYKSTLLNKLHFLYRSLANPIKLLWKIKGAPPSTVLFNDFDQLTAPVWVPIFKVLAPHHIYKVILHDPDRDAYPPNLAMARYSMAQVMGLMNKAYYHTLLPDKPYYKNPKTEYLSIPHGLYPEADKDETIYKELRNQVTANITLLGFIGNIRKEKNLDRVIEALKHFPTAKLLVAGTASNSSVSVEEYKSIAEEMGVSHQIIWINRYLSDAELSATFAACDLILLYYSKSFVSQSGILNSLAGHKKPLLVSETESALTKTVKDFNLGLIVKPDETPALIEGLKDALEKQSSLYEVGWENYRAYAQWDKAAELLLN